MKRYLDLKKIAHESSGVISGGVPGGGGSSKIFDRDEPLMVSHHIPYYTATLRILVPYYAETLKRGTYCMPYPN